MKSMSLKFYFLNVAAFIRAPGCEIFMCVFKVRFQCSCRLPRDNDLKINFIFDLHQSFVCIASWFKVFSFLESYRLNNLTLYIYNA